MAGRRHLFARKVLTVATGVGAAQGALVLASPLLTRIYSPDDFAAYAVFTVLAHLLAIIGTGRYEMALVLPEREEEALHALALAVVCPLVLAAAGYGVLCFAWALGIALPTWSAIVPVGAVAVAWQTAGARWQGRRDRFRSVARGEAAAAIATLGVQFTGGLLPLHEGSCLIAGFLVGRCAAIAVLLRDSGLSTSVTVSSLAPDRMLASARRYVRFPAFTAPSSLIGKLNQSLPKLILPVTFGPHAAGCYSLASRVLQTPSAFLGRAIGDVFFPTVSRMRGNPRARLALVLSVSGASALTIALPTIALFCWAEPIFAALFGPGWEEAGSYARLLLPMMAAQFIVQPIALSLHAFERQRSVLAWQISTFALLLLTIAATRSGQTPSALVLSHSLVIAGMLIAYLGMSCYYASLPGESSVIGQAIKQDANRKAA